MKIKFIILAIATFNIFNTTAQDNWVIDSSHSSVQFAIDHLVISEVTGSFNSFNGSMTMNADDLTTAKLSGEIDVNSVDTKNGQRDDHLKAPDFFDAAKYPKISFKSTSVSKVKTNTYLMKGDLTIKNVTKPIELEVIYKGTANFMGQTKTGLKATTIINRAHFGLSYHSLLETGGAVVGKEVRITLNFELVKR
jgi:polyisoprenoid-binding protein YceI